jgi:hypothetical protein
LPAIELLVDEIMTNIKQGRNKISGDIGTLKTVPITSLKGILPKPVNKVSLKDMKEVIGTGRKHAGIGAQ